MAAEQLYKVAYDEAVRSLSEQQTAIDSFRSRAGLLLSATAITTSFLGAQALRGGDPGLFSWLALVAFAGMAIALLAILQPRRWEFTLSPHDVISTYIESGKSALIEDLHRDLSFHMHSSYLENRKVQKKLFVFFQVANVLLAVEVVFWILAIASIS